MRASVALAGVVALAAPLALVAQRSRPTLGSTRGKPGPGRADRRQRLPKLVARQQRHPSRGVLADRGPAVRAPSRRDPEPGHPVQLPRQLPRRALLPDGRRQPRGRRRHGRRRHEPRGRLRDRPGHQRRRGRLRPHPHPPTTPRTGRTGSPTPTASTSSPSPTVRASTPPRTSASPPGRSEAPFAAGSAPT